ncbi:AAA family ATPase [Bradyrhizobium sp. dw_78]|uniref:AAA family ATPase n=1 Tax=Bradyrhizobium sp. dw_78 TaxID=2719793 RepID=UPI001BD6C658|nr:AAA family ATPase [Bradyrhizobium sp. dw_78]
MRQFVDGGFLSPAEVEDTIWEVAEMHELRGEPGSQTEMSIAHLIREVTAPASLYDPDIVSDGEVITFPTITPSDWSGSAPEPKKWLAEQRIPSGDVTIIGADGGSGKTEIALQLAVAVSQKLGNWLGCAVDAGQVLFLSAEEPEDDIRIRVNRICHQYCINPDTIRDLHFRFPDLDATLLIDVDVSSSGIRKTNLFRSMEGWVRSHGPALVIIDAVAAVFGADNVSRKQVRAFIAALRKIAHETGAAFLLLDHPSVRGMRDQTGTVGSVDWNNAVRSRMYLTTDRRDPDARTLEIMKANGGKRGEKISLRWTAYTFVVERIEAPPRHVAADAVDDIFLRLLEKFTARGRHVFPHKGRGFAPKEFESHPDAGGISTRAFAASMDRLLSTGKIVAVQSGPPSKRVTYIAIAGPNND